MKIDKKILYKNFFWMFNIIMIVLLLFSCHESFEPLLENETAPFSIYGFLDTSADTQWIRIAPLRQQIDMPPEKPEMLVRLEHIESGHSQIMKDSLFLRADGFNYLNAWSNINIEPAQTYRLTVTRLDGLQSHVTVSTPDEFPTPRVLFVDDVARVFISGIDRLADVHTRWLVRIIAPDSGWDFKRIFWIPHRHRVRHIATSGDYELRISIVSDFANILEQIVIPPRGELQVEVIQKQIYVASGGPEWNEEIAFLGDLVYAHPDIILNVENGVGYLIGVTSKAIPFESCYNDQFELIACDVVKTLY